MFKLIFLLTPFLISFQMINVPEIKNVKRKAAYNDDKKVTRKFSRKSIDISANINVKVQYPISNYFFCMSFVCDLGKIKNKQQKQTNPWLSRTN